MKAVLDTNIFVSALALPGGQAEKAIVHAAQGSFDLVISKPIIHEVLGVLSRKFDREAEELSRVAVFLADLGSIARPRRKLRVLRDEPDNRILECALAAHAELIVTGDRTMLELGEFEGIRIVTLREFLDLLG
ncbi:MAG: putative toxin-antitoxin system toxin component, PIN family [Betaproteobacteria bacterium]|nr:putative toxin-antitoxin system toxin component, PIN family [Betaproteobacteria bacterium]